MSSPFNLETGPLIRIALYRRGEKNVLQITAHHLVADFWSLGIAFEEIGQIYAAETGSAADLSPARVPSYSEFVHQEVELLSGPDFVSRGFLQVDSDESDGLFEEARERVTKALEGDTARQPDVSYLVGKVRDTLNSFVYERTRRRPMILPLVTEV